jgi:RNA recognition motif-containing protein
MQWQDLKDLFRPAGVVIRADVASTPDGQSRGFGTVLLASADDAQRAATMFNG